MQASILFVLVIALTVFIFARPDIIRKIPRFKMIAGSSIIWSLVGLVSYTHILTSEKQFFILICLGGLALAGYHRAFKKVKKK